MITGVLPRRFLLVVAAVELTCGVLGAAWLTAQGVLAERAGGPDRTPFDRAILFVLAAAVLVGLGISALRHLRQAREAPPAAPPRPAAPAPEAGPQDVPDDRPPPVLSDAGRADLRRIVAALDAVGVFAPRAPEPRHLQEAAADHGEPVEVYTALAALHEAEYHHPDFRFEDHTANLAFHDGHTEQDAEALRAQVADLGRLTGDVAGTIEQSPDGRTRARLTVAGAEHLLDFHGHPKYLSTVIHVTAARALRDAGSARRLAWVWGDQGVWITVPAGGLPDGFAWVDEEEPSVSA